MASKIIALVLAVVIIAGNVACYMFSDIITMYLCGFGFNEDSEEAIAARESGNALAELVAGSEAHFADLMNDKVKFHGS